MPRWVNYNILGAMDIISGLGCNNSPKNEFIEHFAIALLSGERSEIQRFIPDSFAVTVPGHFENQGIDAYLLYREGLGDFDELTCDASISHGKQGSFIGVLERSGTCCYVSIHVQFKTLKADAIQHAIVFMISS